eukprot:scaffold43503_cov38-Attheya_sp.AAC.1
MALMSSLWSTCKYGTHHHPSQAVARPPVLLYIYTGIAKWWEMMKDQFIYGIDAATSSVAVMELNKGCIYYYLFPP